MCAIAVALVSFAVTVARVAIAVARIGDEREVGQRAGGKHCARELSPCGHSFFSFWIQFALIGEVVYTMLDPIASIAAKFFVHRESAVAAGNFPWAGTFA